MVKQLNYEIHYNNTKLKWSNPDFTGLIEEQMERTKYKIISTHRVF
jgi:hypothetical protein